MHLFGTDGIRGIANQELTEDLAYNLGITSGALLCAAGDSVVIGRDTRDSGEWLESAIIKGFNSQGVNVIKAGMIPTPAISFLTRSARAKLGVVISASHNPSEYNGIKIFNKLGIKLDENLEDAIEKKLEKINEVSAKASANGNNTEVNGAELYLEHLKETVSVSLEDFTVMLDCANGAASFVGPSLFEALGTNIKSNACTPNGRNINFQCGSTHPQNLRQSMKTGDFAVGFAFDGDADRVIAVDEKGQLVDGDYIIAICAKQLHKEGNLKGNKVVTTVMTNLGFHLAMKELGIEVLSTKVGDKYVLDAMLESDAVLGGEQSGHIIFSKYGPAGDGLLTALQLLQILKKTGKPLSELAKVMERLPQVLLNVQVKEKNGWNENIRLSQAIKSAEDKLGEKGRLLVRPSGTEALIRVMTESHSLEHAQDVAQSVAEVVKEEFS